MKTRINGVKGRVTREVKTSKFWANQVWRATRSVGDRQKLHVTLRFDDRCGNGHNTFGITGEIRQPTYPIFVATGCIHTEIKQTFPELAHLIKWHGCSTDGPMHYVQNTLWHAGDRDYDGLKAGDIKRTGLQVYFGSSPVGHSYPKPFLAWLETRYRESHGEGLFRVQTVLIPPRDGYLSEAKYSLVGYTDQWHACPFDSKREAQEFADALNTCESVRFEQIPLEYSQGKERDFDAARCTAIWPEATDEQLSAPREELKAALLARLPALLDEFRNDMDAAGLYWSPEVAP